MIGRLLGRKEGQSLTEFAMVLPVILLLIMGAITFGMLIYVKTLVVLSSSQAGRVAASIYNDSSLTLTEKEDKIRTTAYYYLGSGISGTDRDVDVTSDGVTITVKVTYNYKLIMPFLGDILGSKTVIPVKYETTFLIQ